MNTHARKLARTVAPTPPAARAGVPHDLIASDRVEGTDVYRPTGDRIGYIERIMLDKHTGKAAYVVMNFGGFLGLGEESYPLPWSVLTYNPRLGGYEVDVTDEQLKGAPRYRGDDWARSADRERDSAIYGYWGVPPYWV